MIVQQGKIGGCSFKDVQIQTKKKLRENILSLLRNQKEEDRLKKSRVIQKKLFKETGFKCSKTILFYFAFDGEVETLEMISQAKKIGKKIALPSIIKAQKRIVPIVIENLQKDLCDGPYGIKQPRYDKKKSLDFDEMDLVIVPGIAFDRNNYRLGRGAGYYDRFLGALPSHVPTLGLAFDFQIVDSIPHLQEHDVPVSRVIVN